MKRQMNALSLVLGLAVTTAPVARAQHPAGGPPWPGNDMGLGKAMVRVERMERMERGPGDMRMRGMPGMRGQGESIASMLLARTAELKLTDQQVTKLAAIARREGDRRTAMHAHMDSLMHAEHMQVTAGQQSAPRPMMMMHDRDPMMDRMREQDHADLRDALGVLSIDQLADAWVMRGHGDGPWHVDFMRAGPEN